MTVSLLVQHHEGAGAPRTVDLSHAGYSYGIFDGGHWANWRQPDDPRGPGFHDFATDGYNGKACSVVLTGDRSNYPVTPDDLQAMRKIAAHAREHGWLTAAPAVFAHRQMPPPNATVCAGEHVGPEIPAKGLTGDNFAWMTIVPCYHEQEVPALPQTIPQMWPGVGDIVAAASFGPTHQYVVMVSADGHVFCPDGGYVGGPYDDKTGKPKPYWMKPDGTIRGAARVSGTANGYVITSTAAEAYTYPEK